MVSDRGDENQGKRIPMYDKRKSNIPNQRHCREKD